jgi:hypothetical protein
MFGKGNYKRQRKGKGEKKEGKQRTEKERKRREETKEGKLNKPNVFTRLLQP